MSEANPKSYLPVPRQRPSLDPAQARLSVRLRGFGIGVSDFYVDICELMAASSLRSTTHLVGHLMREVESSIRRVLIQFVPRSARTGSEERKKNGDTQASEIELICSHLDIDSGVGSVWRGLGLAQIAHRNALQAARAIDAEFRSRLGEFEVVLHALVERLETTFTEVYPLVDELAAVRKPTDADHGSRLANELPQSDVVLERFFTNAGVGWFPVLQTRGYFGNPPPLEIDESGAVAYPWPAGEYLVRMAGTPSLRAEVVEVSVALRTNNAAAHECVARAALAMPAADAAILAPKVAEFCAAPVMWRLPIMARDLVRHLAGGGEIGPALLVYSALLRVPDRDHGIISELVEGLTSSCFPALGTTGMAALADALDFELDRRDLPKEFADGSFIWRPSLASERGHHRRQDKLISAIRDASAAVAREGDLTAALETLERRPRAIFTRLALDILREVPDEAMITDRLNDRRRFDDLNQDREYSALLREHFANLGEVHQAEILSWIDRGPETGLGEMQDLDTWRQHQLARFGDALPPDLQARLDELTKGIEAEVGAENSSLARSPSACLSRDELLTSPDDELISLFSDWQPTDGGPSRWPTDDLANQVRSAAVGEPQRFSSLLARLPDSANPVLIASILAGLSEVAREDDVDLSPVLDYAERVASTSGERPKLAISAQIRRSVAELICAALGRDLADSVLEKRALLVLESYARGQSADQLQTQGDDKWGATTLALNTAEGTSLRGLVRYVWNLKEREPRGPVGLPDYLANLLDELLQPDRDPHGVVRAVIGEFLPIFLVVDLKWTRGHLDLILPPDDGNAQSQLHHRSAWLAYLNANRAYSNLFAILEPEYMACLESLEDDSQRPGREGNEAREALTHHVLDLTARGVVKVGAGGLLEKFFERSSTKMRARLFKLAGIGAGEDEPPPLDVLSRLQGLWEWRIGQLRMNPQPGSLDELAGFGWWYSSGRFEERWAPGPT